MSGITNQAESCQVDFYLPLDPSVDFKKEACRLALMAWQQKNQILIVTADPSACAELDELMWHYPAGRFLPHAVIEGPDAAGSPVRLGVLSDLQPADVVINLCPEVIPQPEMFSRILEFIPFNESERKNSRLKFKTYRDMGLKPRMNEINR